MGPASGPGPDTTKLRRGYAMVAVSFVVMGSIGAVVDWAQAPASMLVVLRMGIGALVLAAVFARRPMLAEIRRPGIPRLLLAMGAIDAVTLLLFFSSVRMTNVAIAMFLLFLSPLWVALLAPPILGAKTDRIVWPAFGIALAGLACIIVPPALGDELDLSLLGVIAALLSGIGLAGFMMTVNALRARGLRSATIVIVEGILDALILLPLAVWQTWVTGSGLTGRDIVAGLFLGTVCTAFAYLLLTEGMGFIPVQHVPILGYLEPLAAPLYAFVLVGETPGVWTLVGGLFIVGAGTLLVLKGTAEGAEEAAAELPVP
jgi:drug/metabolite transporter (DMT)-like permease